jgi:phosphoenolpyruvate carboxykinase (GTP)
MDYSSALTDLPEAVREYVTEKARLCQPDRIVVCDGSEEEFKRLTELLQKEGVIVPLKKLNNW